MTERHNDAIVPYTRVPDEDKEDEEEDEYHIYETKDDGSTVGIPTVTRVKTE